MSDTLDPVTLSFPADPSTWPAAYAAFQVQQAELVTPSIAEVVVPDNPTLQAPIPVQFSSAGNQPSGPFRTVW
jgi:hypothetical protein